MKILVCKMCNTDWLIGGLELTASEFQRSWKYIISTQFMEYPPHHVSKYWPADGYNCRHFIYQYKHLHFSYHETTTEWNGKDLGAARNNKDQTVCFFQAWNSSKYKHRLEGEMKMYLQAVGKGIYCTDWAQDRDRWRALVNAVMNLRVP